jgi:hypothetical protein
VGFDPLQGVIDDLTRGKEYFHTRLPAVSDEFRGKEGCVALAHLGSGSFGVLNRLFGDKLTKMFMFGLVTLSHKLFLTPIFVSLDYCTANGGCQGVIVRCPGHTIHFMRFGYETLLEWFIELTVIQTPEDFKPYDPEMRIDIKD